MQMFLPMLPALTENAYQNAQITQIEVIGKCEIV